MISPEGYIISADEFVRLKSLLAKVRNLNDRGPCGLGWQSDELQRDIAVVQDFIDDCEFLDKADRKLKLNGYGPDNS